MFQKPFHLQLRSLRRLAGFNQKQVAESVGMCPKRWNSIELGKRRPTSIELLQIQSRLGPVRGFLRPLGIIKKLSSAGRRALEDHRPYYCEQDQPAYMRYFTAAKRHPVLVQGLRSVIAARADFEECEYLCHQIAYASHAEVIFALQLLARGAIPALLAPAWLPSTPCPIVDPNERIPVAHCPMPCLLWRGQFYFFQVSFSTPRVYTVDVLSWSQGWRAIEIEGEAHAAAFDSQRTEAIRIPFLRYTYQDILEENFRAA